MGRVQIVLSATELRRGITSQAAVGILLSSFQGIVTLWKRLMLDYSVVKVVESWSSTSSFKATTMSLPTTTKHARFIVYAVWFLSVSVLVDTGNLAKAIAAFFVSTLFSIILHRWCFGVPLFCDRREEG
jgi:hypothetical protein